MAPITDLQKSELLTAVFNRETTRIRMLLDRGQTMLAVIAAVSPFIGLLGTVVGIFGTLTDIAGIEEPSLQVISGSIGETLIMTAIGLVVAIPAVFAYNLFARFNYNAMIRIRQIAKSYHTLIVYKLKNDDF
jgi:biopolymer transport protein ExbB